VPAEKERLASRSQARNIKKQLGRTWEAGSTGEECCVRRPLPIVRNKKEDSAAEGSRQSSLPREGPAGKKSTSAKMGGKGGLKTDEGTQQSVAGGETKITFKLPRKKKRHHESMGRGFSAARYHTSYIWKQGRQGDRVCTDRQKKKEKRRKWEEPPDPSARNAKTNRRRGDPGGSPKGKRETVTQLVKGGGGRRKKMDRRWKKERTQKEKTVETLGSGSCGNFHLRPDKPTIRPKKR